MLEVYSPGDMQSPDYECGIWVPVCRNGNQPGKEDGNDASEIVSTMTVMGLL